MTTLHMNAGLDIGNGYVKGLISTAELGENGQSEVDIPSGARMLTHIREEPLPDGDAAETTGEDFFNKVDASFTSPLVNDTHRFTFGRKAIQSEGVFYEFEVSGSRHSKAQQSLSGKLVLGIVAAKAVADHVRLNGGALPEMGSPVEVEVVMALALPISEFSEHRKSYADGFTAHRHQVTVHNFETPVTVVVTFTKVGVIAEGAAAQYALNANPKLIQLLLDQAREHGDDVEGVTVEDVISAQNTIGADIGEGTVNFPLFMDGKFNASLSRSYGRGYGNVLDTVLKTAEDDNMPLGFTSRKQLADYMQSTPSRMPAARRRHENTKALVDEQARYFCEEVTAEFGRLLEAVGASVVEVVYVYGGGSGKVEPILRSMLSNKISEMTGAEVGEGALLLYLDAEWSRKLNRNGLMIAAQALARQKDAGK